MQEEPKIVNLNVWKLHTSSKRFSLGRIVATPEAMAFLIGAGVEAIDLLMRHQSGDWGDIHRTDQTANDQGVSGGDRLLSSYLVGNHRIWIITEADRSVTTILLPGQY